MPLGLITNSGSTPISYMASIMRSEIALWPHPAQSVVLPPLYSMTVRPMRLVLGAPDPGAADPGSTVVVPIWIPSAAKAAVSNSAYMARLKPLPFKAFLLAFHARQFVGDRSRIQRQSCDVSQAAQARDQFGLEIEL